MLGKLLSIAGCYVCTARVGGSTFSSADVLKSQYKEKYFKSKFGTQIITGSVKYILDFENLTESNLKYLMDKYISILIIY